MGFRLINLDCPACGSTMNGGPHDILFLCAHCGSGAVLGETSLEIVQGSALMPTPGRRATRWLPGWSIETDVVVDERLLTEGQSTPGWSGRRRFIVPAFPLDLQDLTPLSRALSSAVGTTGEIPKEPCHSGTLYLEDALIFIRHLVVGAEVEKSDNLATVTVTVSPVHHSIVALPFEYKDGRLRCAVTGTTLQRFS